MNWQPEIDELHQRERLAHHMGGKEKVAKHHAQGRLTVRERIEALFDTGTFHEIGALAGTAEYNEGQLTEFRPANFVFGTGRIDGRKVVVGRDDFTVRGGAADAAVMGKQVYSEQLANSLQIPIVRLVDGTGGGGLTVEGAEAMIRLVDLCRTLRHRGDYRPQRHTSPALRMGA